MTRPAPAPRAVSLHRAVGIDVAMVAFGVGAVIVSFLTGQGVPRWHNLVFTPIVFVLAAITLRLGVAEMRALWPVLPDAPRKGEAVTALVVAIATTVVVAPMLVIMPAIFLAAI